MVPSPICTVWSLTIALVAGPVRHVRQAEMVRDTVESNSEDNVQMLLNCFLIRKYSPTAVS